MLLWEEPGSKYFMLCEPHGVDSTCSALSLEHKGSHGQYGDE